MAGDAGQMTGNGGGGHLGRGAVFSAIHIHSMFVTAGLNDYFLLRQSYKATIIRLANVMKVRCALLPITHTHSHF